MHACSLARGIIILYIYLNYIRAYNCPKTIPCLHMHTTAGFVESDSSKEWKGILLWIWSYRHSYALKLDLQRFLACEYNYKSRSSSCTEMSHMILFILSATFVVMGMAIISIGMICRLCRVHRFHSNELYKPIKDCSTKIRMNIGTQDIIINKRWVKYKYTYKIYVYSYILILQYKVYKYTWSRHYFDLTSY